MLVPVVAVRGVAVLSMYVVDVVAMPHRFVAAVRPVFMLVSLVDGMRRLCTLVPVPVVRVVAVSVVQVIDVVPVTDGSVPTVWGVLM